MPFIPDGRHHCYGEMAEAIVDFATAKVEFRF
jgi:hypothetical protein